MSLKWTDLSLSYRELKRPVVRGQKIRLPPWTPFREWQQRKQPPSSVSSRGGAEISRKYGVLLLLLPEPSDENIC